MGPLTERRPAVSCGQIPSLAVIRRLPPAATRHASPADRPSAQLWSWMFVVQQFRSGSMPCKLVSYCPASQLVSCTSTFRHGAGRLASVSADG